jgi:hypothetical protein
MPHSDLLCATSIGKEARTHYSPLQQPSRQPYVEFLVAKAIFGCLEQWHTADIRIRYRWGQSSWTLRLEATEDLVASGDVCIMHGLPAQASGEIDEGRI